MTQMCEIASYHIVAHHDDCKSKPSTHNSCSVHRECPLPTLYLSIDFLGRRIRTQLRMHNKLCRSIWSEHPSTEQSIRYIKELPFPGIWVLLIHRLHAHQTFKMCVRTIVNHICNVCGDVYSRYPHADIDACRDVRSGRRCRSGLSTEPLHLYSGVCGRCIVDEENIRRRRRGIRGRYERYD